MTLTELHRTTAFRLSILFAVLMTAGAAALAFYIYWHAEIQMDEELDREVRNELLEILEAPPELTLLVLQAQEREAQHWRGGLFAADGTHLAGRLTQVPADLPMDCMVHDVKVPLGESGLTVHIAGEMLPDGRMVVLSRDTEEQERFRRLILSSLAGGLPIAVAVALLAGIAISFGSLRRIDAIHRSASAIMKGDLTRRLPMVGRGDDFDKLAQIVNAMLDKIETLMDGLKAAGDNIAHDLRTPLTHLRTSLERSLRAGPTADEREDAIADAISQTDEILEKFRALLRISEVEDGKRRAAFRMVDLQQIARAVCDLYEPVAADRQQRLTLRSAGPAPVLGDRDLLFDLLGNLVDNAIKFTPEGGAIAIVLESKGPEGRGSHTLAVEDTGPGIPPELRETMFRRFTRADRARQAAGSGLGLSLVAAVAGLHDADITIRQTDAAFRIAVTFRAVAGA